METPKIRRVAVIGAGISGVLAGAHLIAAGLEVVVLERNNAPGGVWLYDDRKVHSIPYPSVKASQADLPAADWPENVDLMLRYAPPGPCYYSLKTNVPTPLMEVTLHEWPPSTPDYVEHTVVQSYIQDLSTKARVHQATVYGARVQLVEKKNTSWALTWMTAQKSRKHETHGLEHTELFDAVVVASGHYHAPRVPDIPGLSQAKKRYGDRIMHSKEYRSPESFRNRNVLIIGGGVSSVDIAKDFSMIARTIYQSTRNSKFDLDPRMLPKNAIRIDEVAFFEVHDHNDMLSESETLPVSIHLVSGKRLQGIDSVLLCTGYHITLPFLRDYHCDEVTLENATNKTLVTDGTQVHNLHKDIFYMPDPTLAFVGLPYYTFTFSVFDFQALVVAQVFSGIVDLPSLSDMTKEYDAKVEEVGLGKTFHSIHGKEEGYVADLLSWVNKYRAIRGKEPIAGFPSKWYDAKEALRQRFRKQVLDQT